MEAYTCWDYECEDECEKEDIQAESMIEARNKYAWKMIGYIGEQHEYELTIAVEREGVVAKWMIIVVANLEFTFNEAD